MSKALPTKLTGFTLIEMLMVILIIAATTKIVAVSMQDFGFAARYEQTVSRLDTIRQAIVGNPKRTINGQPDISGFVADMGRLPINMRELISSNAFCIDPDYGTDLSNNVLFGTKVLCEAAFFTWHEIASVTGPNINEGNLIAGWRGPYIQVNDAPTSSSVDVYTDGWGNEANVIAPFEHYYDYGWYWCHWDTSGSPSDDADGNGLPDDSNGTPNNFPNCNLISISALEHLTIYSLGKNGSGDVAVDGSVTCGANEYDGDCYTSIVKEDYSTDISTGIDVRLETPKVGFCGFTNSGDLAINYFNNKYSCKNSGGQYGSSCYFTKSNCETSGGTWNFSTASCKILNSTICNNSSADTPPGFGATTWDPPTNECHFTKAECSAAAGNWRGVTACQFDANNCPTAATGGWGDLTNECSFTSINCATESGIWDSATKSCDFTPADCSAKSSVPHSWGCVIDRRSCGSLGGFWNYCEFQPDQCNNLTVGSSWISTCHLTNSRCANAGGSWEYDINTKKYDCSFNVTTCPTSLGATWDGANCKFPSGSCSILGGTNLGKCNLSQVDCGAVGGDWDPNTGQCGFDQNTCRNRGGVPRNKDCFLTHTEATGSRYNRDNCENNVNSEWIPIRKQVCMNVFFRRASDSTISYVSSNPVTVTENGYFQSIHFSFSNDTSGSCTSNNGNWDGSSCSYPVSIGNNAIAIYEYDGDCDFSNNVLYPADREEPISVQFVPKVNLPVINW